MDSHQLREKFYSLETPEDVAALLNITLGELDYCLYLKEPKYITFKIPKNRGGFRIISAPHTGLKLIQMTLNEILNQVYKPKKSVHGFVTNRSIKTNALPHKNRRYVFNLDLEDFFPSIHFGRVQGLFLKPPYNLPEDVAKILARICCTYEGLPQGAPTSPIISNMICRKLDSQLQELAKKHRCYYTRYADDITFSTHIPHFPEALAKYVSGELIVGDELKKIIDKDNNFKINNKKLRLQTRNTRQEVTGLVVNQHVNVNRRYIRQIRVMLHDWRKAPDKANPVKALERHQSLHPKHKNPNDNQEVTFNRIVRGKIEFVKMILGEKNPVYHNLASQLAELDPDFARHYKPLKLKIFLNYAREDEGKVEKIFHLLKETGFDPWMDREEITGGDEWEKKIKQAIDEVNVFIACLTSISVKKDGYVQEEIAYALERDKDKRQSGDSKFIIPVLVEKCEPQACLKEFNWVHYYKPDGWQNLRKAILNSQ